MLGLGKGKGQEASKTIGAHVIVVGNEKGGSGKSTTAMHLSVALLQQGRSVASIDVDARQGTFSRYVANRERFIKASGNDVKVPRHHRLDDPENTGDLAQRLQLMIEGATINHDIIIVDSPGSDNDQSRLAHSYADTLITPVNDSLVDFDVLAHVDGAQMAIKGPSHYSEMVWEQKKRRADRDGGTIDWIVMRNRIHSLDSLNTQEVDRLIKDLSKRIGFRVIPGFTERVIFRELFLAGLTILDLKDASGAKALSPSHHAARQEVFTLVNAIGLPPPPAGG